MRMTDRSTKFSSSRMLPGQSHRTCSSMVFDGTLVMDFFIRWANLVTKYSTSGRMSSRR